MALQDIDNLPCQMLRNLRFSMSSQWEKKFAFIAGVNRSQNLLNSPVYYRTFSPCITGRAVPGPVEPHSATDIQLPPGGIRRPAIPVLHGQLHVAELQYEHRGRTLRSGGTHGNLQSQQQLRGTDYRADDIDVNVFLRRYNFSSLIWSL